MQGSALKKDAEPATGPDLEAPLTDEDKKIIEKRLNPGQANLEVTQKYLSEFAVTGLRTLLIASKELSDEEYQAWSFKYVKAATSLADKEKQINAVAEKLEVGFELLGATAIEDKL